jgi:hypothetical protein
MKKTLLIIGALLMLSSANALTDLTIDKSYYDSNDNMQVQIANSEDKDNLGTLNLVIRREGEVVFYANITGLVDNDGNYSTTYAISQLLEGDYAIESRLIYAGLHVDTVAFNVGSQAQSSSEQSATNNLFFKEPGNPEQTETSNLLSQETVEVEETNPGNKTRNPLFHFIYNNLGGRQFAEALRSLVGNE